jgi:hypothetical protein
MGTLPSAPGEGVAMSAPPMGVMPGVMPNGVAPTPTIGVAPGATATPAGVSSQRERCFLPAGVAPTAGVSPGAQPGVAAPSACVQPTQYSRTPLAALASTGAHC